MTKNKGAAAKGTSPSVSPFLFFLPVLFAIMLEGGGVIPVTKVFRNILFPARPNDLVPVHGTCGDEMWKEMTIVVSVKDACSQAPGFLEGLHKIVPPSVHLIYSFPNFTSCASINMDKQFNYWDKVTPLPLPLRSSPMQGWYDAVPKIDTKYTLLLHNDGYALDDFFACELLRGLHSRQQAGNETEEGEYIASAPMLYESKKDGSLAAHATQENLRLVKNPDTGEVTVRHDHSVAKALNRGLDFPEGPQTEFLEDHGFMIKTDKIQEVIDPEASFTLEYIDMIMTIRSNNWKVLFVPTARLEFRITEFSWRDIPYFMYKRSEITAHGTRDYLKAKWKANFPNTGFWTFIKYTIVEQHRYHGKEVKELAWKDQAAMVFGFFQMVGFNRYTLPEPDGKQDFLYVLEKLDAGWKTESSVHSSRELQRPKKDKPRATKVEHLSEILPMVNKNWVNIEADLPLENLPFAAAVLTLDSCNTVTSNPGLENICGLVLKQNDGCQCWINLPTFKSNSLLVRFLDEFAGWVKIPSRVTTYLEMFMHSTRNGTQHVLPLRKFEKAHNLTLVTCDQAQHDCSADFEFTKETELLQFYGRPPSAAEVAHVLHELR